MWMERQDSLHSAEIDFGDGVYAQFTGGVFSVHDDAKSVDIRVELSEGSAEEFRDFVLEALGMPEEWVYNDSIF